MTSRVWLSICFLSVSVCRVDTMAGQESGADSSKVTLVLVDSRGKGVAGVKVGTQATYSEGRLLWNVGGENTSVLSDGRGRVFLDGDKLFRPDYPDDYKAAIYALDEEKGLAGLGHISRADLGRELKIEMVKACRVRGTVDSSELRELGYEVTHKVVWLKSDVPRCSEFLVYEYNRHRYDRDAFEFLVPPGNYRIRAGASSDLPGVRTEEFEQVLEVEPGKRELDLGVLDPAATRLTRLIGKPAPELEGIREWKNGRPAKLADLRGKIVLLHFWVYFCDRVYPQMHKLIDLYREVQRNKLDIEIIVIHDGRFETFAEMEAKFNEDPRLVKVREEKWGGKNLPFLMALDSKEPARHLGGRTYLRGINWANYDINTYPATILIDRRGVLVGEFGFNDTASALEQLRAYLAVRAGDVIEGFDEFGLNLPLDSARGKMILVCFFDMQQRPSRNCIRRLAVQIEQLKEKGVTVVAVQASKVDENKLNEWVKKNNISFPVGSVRGDEEKIRFAWGVKSLPWLILTDKQHIVIAEGFAANELDEKIKQ